MKKILERFVCILICSALVFLVGCSNQKQLTEGKAETEIKKLLQKDPQQKTMSIPEVWWLGFYGNRIATAEDDKDRPKFLELGKRGLLKVNYEQVQSTPAHPGWTNIVYRRISLTDEGKKYLIKATPGEEGQNLELLLGELRFHKITGITVPSDAMGQKMSQVNFEVKWHLTPFGEVLTDSKDNVEQHNAGFVLYNDGWRLEM